MASAPASTADSSRFVYLHYEGERGPARTVKHALLASAQTLDGVVDAFVAAYNKGGGGGAVLDAAQLDLRHESGRFVSFVAGDEDALQHRADVFLIDCSPRKRLPAKVAAAAPSAPSSSSVRPAASNSASASVQDLRALVSKKRYAEARRACEAALSRKPQPDSATTATLASIMTDVMIATGKFDAAVEYGEQAWEGLQRLPAGRQATYTLALAYFHAGQFNEAWLKLRELTTNSEAPSRVAGSAAQNLDLDIIALQAECLFAAGRHTEAAGHLNGHMNDAGAEEHMSILVAYSSFALQYGKVQEALRAMLKAVTLDQRHKRARKMLADILQTDAGFEDLLVQLPPSDKSAAAYAFLATICKEFSAIPACIALLTIAQRHRPDSAGYALNLMHAIELQCDFDAAIASVRAFLGGNALLRAGSRLSCSDLLAALDGTARRVENEAVAGYAVKWVDDGDRGYATTHAIVRLQEETYTLEADTAEAAWQQTAGNRQPLDDDALDLLAIGFTLIKLLYLQGRLDALPGLYRCIEPARHGSKTPLHETSIRNEHAYYQCIAQVLSFRLACSSLGLGGAEEGSPAELRSPLAACCNVRASALYTEASARPIYTLGDSHCLSSAWSVLHIAGCPRLVVPKLVTGVKHWHLRPDSDFYPKFNFRQAVAGIPDGSDVVAIVGEIDCREGILVAVERDKYASVQEGMRNTLAIFGKVLAGLASTKRLRLFVHPVLPMLPETRPLVLAYNTLYREAVRRLKLSPPCAWLDFFDDLFAPEGEGAGQEQVGGGGGDLRAGLVMDGTHISPSYCSLVEAHINKCLQTV